MIRILTVLLALSALFAPAKAVAVCPLPSSGASNEAGQFFRAVTLADHQTQAGGYEVLKATTATPQSPFDVVYALRSNLSRLECAWSLVAPFQHSTDDKIATAAQLMMTSLQTLHWGAQRILDRVNSALSGHPLPKAQLINDSAADTLKQQDAMNNLALTATMAAMLIRGCDPGAASCNRLLLSPEQRKDLTGEWATMADPQHSDDIAQVARSVVKMLRDPNNRSSSPTRVSSLSQ